MRRKQRTEPLLHASNSSVTKMIGCLSVVVGGGVGGVLLVCGVVVFVVVVVVARGGGEDVYSSSVQTIYV